MSLPWSEKEEKLVGADLDEVMILDSQDTDPDTINKRLKLENIPSVANSVSDGFNVGTGEEVFKIKNGTVLDFRTLIGQTDKLVLTENTNDITFTLGSLVVTTDNENSYEAGKTQNFIASTVLAGININSQVPSTTDMGDIWRDNNIINFHDEDDNIQSIVTESVAQVLTNKTIDADNNAISNLELGMEVTGASTNLTDSANIPLLNLLNDFTVGTQSLFFVSESADPAENGIFRMANEDFIAWKDGLTTGDLPLGVNSSDFLIFNSNFVPSTSSQGILNQVLSSNGPGFNPSFKDVSATVFPVSDDVMIIEGSAESTKRLRFEVDGFTAGFTRVITPPDENITLVNTSNGFITNTNLTTGSFSSITGVGTLTSGTWNADTITVPFGGTGVVTLTANGVLFGNGISAITSNAIATGDILFGNGGAATIGTMSGNATIDNTGAVTVTLASTDLTDTANLVRVTTINTFQAFLQNFVSASMRIPSSATPTITDEGDFAIDNDVTDFSHGIIEYFSTEAVGVVSMPIAEFANPVDGDIISYNATNDEFELGVPSGTFLPLVGGTMLGNIDMNGFDLPSVGILDYDNSTVTIAAGLVTVVDTYQNIAGEGGVADDLSDITAGTIGQYLIIRPADGAITITVVDTGNIVLQNNQDFVMDDIEDTMTLIYDGTNWVEISRNAGITSSTKQTIDKTTAQTYTAADAKTAITDMAITMPNRPGRQALVTFYPRIEPDQAADEIRLFVDDSVAGTLIEQIESTADTGAVTSHPISVAVECTGQILTMSYQTTGVTEGGTGTFIDTAIESDGASRIVSIEM